MAPRRASTSSHPLWFFVALILVAALVCGYLLLSQLNDPFRTLTQLPAQSYLENSNALRGNIYRIDGKVANQLDWSPSAGRLISVELEGGSDIVALIIPTTFNAVNIQKGQRFVFEIEVADRGILRARNLRKV